MSAARNPQPFSATFSLRGRPAEVTDLFNELCERLQAVDWKVSSSKRGRSPLRADTLTEGDQWLVATIATPPPHRISRTSEYELAVSGLVHDRAETHKIVAALPFTPLEIEFLIHDMPLTASVRERAPTWMTSLAVGSQPLAGHGAIFTIHHQTDFVLLLEVALQLGIERELVTVIDKEYRYRFSHRVDAHVRNRLGIPVYRYSELDTGISSHIRRIEDMRQATGAKSWTPSLVIDDGGYILPRLHEAFDPFMGLFKGVVEQTKSGIWKLRPYEAEHRVPIFSVAESELKATVEAHGVAQAALTSLRRLLPHEKFDGRRAIVVGFGTIGEALAELLRRQNIDVHVADSAAPKLVAAREHGFQVADDLAQLVADVQPRYIFSCAEPGAVNHAALACIRRDCALISLTSRDVAFDKEALAELGEAERFGNVGTLYSRKDPSCKILLVADGFPVNFHFSESMPNQQSDLVMASLLAGAITLARTTPIWPPGNDVERANAVLNEGTLLEDFLTLEPGIAPDSDGK